MKIVQIKTLQTPGSMVRLLHNRLLEPRNLIRGGLKVAQGIEAMGNYLSVYEDAVPGIMSFSCAAEIIIDAFERIEEQLVFLEEALLKEVAAV